MQELGPGQRCVVILPDSVRNYMSKFLTDDWMIEQSFMDEKDAGDDLWWSNENVQRLSLQVGCFHFWLQSKILLSTLMALSDALYNLSKYYVGESCRNFKE